MQAVKSYSVEVEASKAEKLRQQLDEADSRRQLKLEPALERWHAAVGELDAILANETKSLEEAQGTLTLLQDRLDARYEEIATLTSRLPNRKAEPEGAALSDVQRKLDVSVRELAILSKMLLTAEENARWLSQINSQFLLSPFWWRFMPTRWQERSRTRQLRRIGLFDARAYLRRYPDVAKAKMDPLRHYILHGQAEGRLR